MKTNLNASNVENLKRTIGNRWSKKGDRLYLDTDFIWEAIHFEFRTYKTGWTSSAWIDGEEVSNNKANKIRDRFRRCNIYIDLATGKLIDCPAEYEQQITDAINAEI